MNRTNRTFDFGGVPVTATVQDEGALRFVADEVAEAAGYKNGRQGPDKITGPWRAQFHEGTHFLMLKGAELHELCAGSTWCTGDAMCPVGWRCNGATGHCAP